MNIYVAQYCVILFVLQVNDVFFKEENVFTYWETILENSFADGVYICTNKLLSHTFKIYINE